MISFLDLLFLVAWSLGSFSAAAYATGGEVGNGGDSVVCEVSKENDFRGYYSLDYLLTYEEAERIAEVKTADASLDRIQKILRARSHDLADSFEDFVRYLPNRTDYTKPRVWEKASYGLVDLKDRKIMRRLPANCLQKKEGKDEIQIVQTVVRQRKKSLVIYQYDAEMLDRLARTAPLQYSFLLVHEWLWDLTSDVDVIRRVNRLLHSERASALKPADFRRVLENMGLLGAFIPVCARTPEIRVVIEHHEKKRCEDIQSITPGELIRFNLQFFGITELRPGDFSGVEVQTKEIRLSGNRIARIPEDSFRGMENLWQLDLTQNHLEALYPGTFEGIHPHRLSLAGNRLKQLPEDIFARMAWVSEIDLSNNPNLVLSPKLFSSVKGLTSLNLSRCGLTEIPEGLFDSASLRSVFLRDNALSPAIKESLQAKYRGKITFSF